MSSPTVRRADKLMSQAMVDELLTTGYCGHLATVGEDGFPYVCPLLYVWLDGKIWLHNTRARGHLQDNVRHDPRVCFEVSLPGQVFAYGRYECDTSIEYQSIVLFGRAAVIDDDPSKSLFFDALMFKYRGNDSTRPKSFYPRLDGVTVYALTVERITGKHQVLPATEMQWPVADHTKSPEASPS
ncbi:pyridoxamine 5'-phosphate oxidase family protein [Variovorax sp. dw_954]|uniref:pyridoxamine 5'-phosphate oxidase family protein n=1 Tax=Variovorax sp. dw_954 TaxID=2720078 RepID=UPI001BD69F01|nr:pyridoxamine 5'-phosphate oxidase family protein [Variovorax sp. dw_954]